MLFTIILIGLINAMIGSNYMFTRYRPSGMNLSILMPSWPYYFFIIIAIGLVFCALLYLIGKDRLNNLFIKSFGNYNSEYSIENNNKQINSNAAEGNLLTYEVFIRK